MKAATVNGPPAKPLSQPSAHRRGNHPERKIDVPRSLCGGHFQNTPPIQQQTLRPGYLAPQESIVPHQAHQHLSRLMRRHPPPVPPLCRVHSLQLLLEARPTTDCPSNAAPSSAATQAEIVATA